MLSGYLILQAPAKMLDFLHVVQLMDVWDLQEHATVIVCAIPLVTAVLI